MSSIVPSLFQLALLPLISLTDAFKGEIRFCRLQALVSDSSLLTPPKFTQLKRAFKTACTLAGINDLHWHDLRHTFGTRLADAGFSEATIAALMGHTDPETTRRYTHATDRAKHAAVEAARLRPQQPQPMQVQAEMAGAA